MSAKKSPLAGMGFAQRIATLALAALAVIALLAVLSGCGRSGGGSAAGASPSSVSSPAASQHSHRSHAPSTEPATPGASPGATVTVADLPPQAEATLRRIDAGGPFPYSRDGVVFGNREGLLPKHPRGWYHEYTVKTPGESDRGARRLIAGKDGTIYYSDDHYESFRKVLR